MVWTADYGKKSKTTLRIGRWTDFTLKSSSTVKSSNFYKPLLLNINMIKDRENIKMAVISGASHALKFRDRHPKATNEEAIRHVTEKMDEILEKIEEENEEF